MRQALITTIAILAGFPLATSAEAVPTGNADRIQVGSSGPVFPESITSTKDGTLYTSSVGTGRIYRATPGAKTFTAWSAKENQGPQSILGVLADEKSGTLWACFSDWALNKGDSGMPAVLRAFDLSSGAARAQYQLPPKSFCNDIAIGADGTVYATDTHEGRIMRLKPGAKELDKFFEDARLVGLDGIAIGKDGALLLDNVKSNKLLRLALDHNGEAGELSELHLSAPVSGPDGLRPGGGGVFYLAENGSGLVDSLAIKGNVTVTPIAHGYQACTSMTQHGDTLYVLEGKIMQYPKNKNAGPFFVYPVRLASP
jgi:sugar lactone lactonase YvrE